VFRKKWESARREVQRKQARRMISSDPVEAFDQLVELRMKDGATPDEARRATVREVSRSIRGWKNEEWEAALQRVVLGKDDAGEVLNARFREIDAEVPPELQKPLFDDAVRQALPVSPGAVTEFVLARNHPEWLAESFEDLVNGFEHSPTFTARAESVGEVVASGGWEAVPEIRESTRRFANRYLIVDRIRAEAWLSTLPPEVAGELKGGSK
jgi:hypothetical protein